MLLQKLLWTMLILGAPFAFIYVFLFQPYMLIRWQGKFYRFVYKDVLQKDDSKLRGMVQLPTDRFLMGNRDEFIRYAETSPEKFQRLAKAYRAIGCLVSCMFLVTCILLVIALRAGAI